MDAYEKAVRNLNTIKARNCERCGKSFTPLDDAEQFCSYNCKDKHEIEDFKNTLAGETIGEQEEWEKTEMYKGFTVAFLREVFTEVENKEHWKKPWSAFVHHSLVRAVQVAAEYFHADDKVEIAGIEKINGRILMHGNGYQAW